MALGSATTALTGDLWAFQNPASWAGVSRPAVAFFAGQAFGLPELRLAALQGAYPVGPGVVSAGLRTFGYRAFRETHLTLGLARAFHPGTNRDLYLGLRVRYQQVRIDGYGSGSAVGLSVGWQVAVWPSLYAGGQATNLNRPAYAGREALPRSFSLGLAYLPSPGLTVVVDVYKEVRYPATVRAGLEVRPVPALALRSGYTGTPSRLTAGVGITLPPVEAGVAAEHHEVLGWSPAFSLTFGRRP